MVTLDLLRKMSFSELLLFVKKFSFISFNTDHCSYEKDCNIKEKLASEDYEDDTPGYEAMWVETSGTKVFYVSNEHKLGLLNENQTGVFFVEVFEDLIIAF